MTGACHQWRPRLVRLLSLTSGTREAFFRLLVQRYNFWELKTNYFATDFGGIFVSAWLITFYRDILVIVLCILIDLEEKWRLAALDFDEAVIWSWSSSVKIISGALFYPIIYYRLLWPIPFSFWPKMTMTDFERICHFLESKSMLDVFAKKCLTLKYLCVYRRANISVFQALVFVLFMFLSFCICCGKNAGKSPNIAKKWLSNDCF